MEDTNLRNAGHRRPFKPGAALLAVLILAGASFAQDKDKKESPFPGHQQGLQAQRLDPGPVRRIGRPGVDNFSVRRSRLTLSGDIMKNMHYKLQIDIAKTPTLLDASVDYEFSKAFQLRVGQFMVPFSLENVTGTSDVDMINRSQPEEKLVPGRDNSAQGRDVGVVGLRDIFRRRLHRGHPQRRRHQQGRHEQPQGPGRPGRRPARRNTWPSAAPSTWASRAPPPRPRSVKRDKAGLELALVYRPRLAQGRVLLRQGRHRLPGTAGMSRAGTSSSPRRSRSSSSPTPST